MVVTHTHTHPGQRYTLKRFRQSLGSHLCLQEVRGRLLRAAVVPARSSWKALVSFDQIPAHSPIARFLRIEG